MNQILVCFDPNPTGAGFLFTLCNIIGTGDKFQLNPVDWTNGDVASIQRDGTLQHRPTGANGPFETFWNSGSFVICAPGPQTYGFARA